MLALPRFLDAPRWQAWLPWLLGLVAAALAAKNLLTSYADFGIYLDVAREFRAGGVDLCRPRDASGPWVYPHVAALPFVLLDGLLGDTGARVEFMRDVELPDRVLLSEPTLQLKTWAYVIWQTRGAAGLQFVKT